MTYAFYFKDNHYCSGCIVDVVVAAGLAPRSAKEENPVAVLERVADERGIDSAWPDGYTGFAFPKVVFPVASHLACEGCGEPLVTDEFRAREWIPTDPGAGRVGLGTDDSTRVDAMAARLTAELTAGWVVRPSPSEACADLVVLSCLCEAVESARGHQIHKALVGGIPVNAVAEACDLSEDDVEVAWQQWVAAQIVDYMSGRKGSQQLLSPTEFNDVLQILARR